MFESYAKYYDIFNADKPYEKEIKFVYKWASRPKKILDIGCGTANYWKYYPENVLISGVEPSIEMVGQSEYHHKIACADVTKFIPHAYKTVDLVTSLFDVMNYIPEHHWWKNLPIKKGGYFIFDIWDKKKVNRNGFTETIKEVHGLTRRIIPIQWSGNCVDLVVHIFGDDVLLTENHRMYLHSHEDIKMFCGKQFEIVEVKPTKRWQTFYKLRRK